MNKKEFDSLEVGATYYARFQYLGRNLDQTVVKSIDSNGKVVMKDPNNPSKTLSYKSVDIVGKFKPMTIQDLYSLSTGATYYVMFNQFGVVTKRKASPSILYTDKVFVFGVGYVYLHHIELIK